MSDSFDLDARYITALQVERATLVAAGDRARVAEVDAELSRLGVPVEPETTSRATTSERATNSPRTARK